MIRSPLRAGLALACALSLTSCGGGDGEFYLSGVVYGINKGDLVLTNNGGSDKKITAAGQFYFDDLVDADSSYNIEVKSVPDNIASPAECKVTGGKGKATFNITTIVVSCTINTHELGGTVTGLAGSTSDKPLVLINGSDRVEVTPAALPTPDTPPASVSQPVKFAKVPEDGKYGITILQQPSDRRCEVANGVGTMLKADITNVQVTCTPIVPAV
ncbi:hypothetical protein QPK31_05165 [Massilia sp. YIM B02769]|uniref:hypothetical protein n=1 Tax=Massilia sp. YIM B02769 TaxID=3050129 RepID=UPI0025B6330F|nr:hypothetical protein [Massilia sp. YIM B02769]MDN4057614.1 hypothetical protein [Massilia sp. YIM B02769]